LLFAQQQFFEEVQRKGYNALWSEGCVQHVSPLASLIPDSFLQVAGDPPPESKAT
jgi:hypothetical protein